MSQRIYMKDEINVRTLLHRPNTAAKALKECDDDLFPKRVQKRDRRKAAKNLVDSRKN